MFRSQIVSSVSCDLFTPTYRTQRRYPVTVVNNSAKYFLGAMPLSLFARAKKFKQTNTIVRLSS